MLSYACIVQVGKTSGSERLSKLPTASACVRHSEPQTQICDSLASSLDTICQAPRREASEAGQKDEKTQSRSSAVGSLPQPFLHAAGSPVRRVRRGLHAGAGFHQTGGGGAWSPPAAGPHLAPSANWSRVPHSGTSWRRWTLVVPGHELPPRAEFPSPRPGPNSELQERGRRAGTGMAAGGGALMAAQTPRAGNVDRLPPSQVSVPPSFSSSTWRAGAGSPPGTPRVPCGRPRDHPRAATPHSAVSTPEPSTTLRAPPCRPRRASGSVPAAGSRAPRRSSAGRCRRPGALATCRALVGPPAPPRSLAEERPRGSPRPARAALPTGARPPPASWRRTCRPPAPRPAPPLGLPASSARVAVREARASPPRPGRASPSPPRPSLAHPAPFPPLGASSGSPSPARFVEVTWRPRNPAGTRSPPTGDGAGAGGGRSGQ